MDRATRNSKNCARQLIYSAVRLRAELWAVPPVDNSEICYICFIIAPQTRQLKPRSLCWRRESWTRWSGGAKRSSSSSSTPSWILRTHVRTLKSKFLRCLKAFKKKTDPTAAAEGEEKKGDLRSQRDNNKRSRSWRPKEELKILQLVLVLCQEPVKAMIMISRAMETAGGLDRQLAATPIYNSGWYYRDLTPKK